MNSSLADRCHGTVFDARRLAARSGARQRVRGRPHLVYVLARSAASLVAAETVGDVGNGLPFSKPSSGIARRFPKAGGLADAASSTVLPRRYFDRETSFEKSARRLDKVLGGAERAGASFVRNACQAPAPAARGDFRRSETSTLAQLLFSGLESPESVAKTRCTLKLAAECFGARHA